MTQPRDVGVLFVGCDELVDAQELSGPVEAGVPRLLTENYPTAEIRVDVETISNLGELRCNLESDDSVIGPHDSQVIVLSVAGDIERLGAGSEEKAILAIRADLVSVIEHIKEQSKARVFVVNLSTLDPTDQSFNYHGLQKEPFSVRAHRLNSMLVSISRETGISVIDADRVIAEKGGSACVVGQAKYTGTGLERIAEELYRVIEDYGFLDERPILEQIGARVRA